MVRPILLTTRQEINAYLQLHRCAYVEDSSNELDHCSRNVIRHQVMPVLQSINPAFVSHAAQSAMLLREDDAYLNRLAEQFLEEHPIQQGLDADALLAAELPVAARVIRAVWGNGLSYGHIRQILELCKKDGLSYTHIPGGVVRCDGGKLWVHEERELPRAFPLEGDQGALGLVLCGFVGKSEFIRGNSQFIKHFFPEM